MNFQLFGENSGRFTPVLTRLPRLSHGIQKPKGLDLWEKEVLPAGVALVVWAGLSAAGWAVIIGLLYWIS